MVPKPSILQQKFNHNARIEKVDAAVDSTKLQASRCNILSTFKNKEISDIVLISKVHSSRRQGEHNLLPVIIKIQGFHTK